MDTPFAKRMRRIFAVLLSVSIVLAGICLMAACYSIYRQGDSPYSREMIADTFSYIAVPVYLCLALVILGVLAHPFLPSAQKTLPPEKNLPLILARLQQKADLSQCDEALQAQIFSCRTDRKRNQYAAAITLALCTLIFLFYALDSAHFTLEDVNGSVVRAVLKLLPCIVLPFGIAILAAIQNKKRMAVEIELLRQAPKTQSPAPSVPVAPTNKLVYVRFVILAVAAGLLLYGACTGGTADVLVKAINICTECVGLG